MSNDVQGSIDQVLARAKDDLDFRDLLLTNPKEAIFKETGMSVPADWDIVSRIDDNGHVAISFANDELPEDYLEVVSGGHGGPGGFVSPC
jgi:hypothetical protein